MPKKCDAVFEGGGVKGIGLVGAVAAIEEAGYDFVNLCGTSAGAIVASLLAVGYSAAEIRNELLHVNFAQFHKKDLLNSLGIVGKLCKIVLKNGVYSADDFENWLNSLFIRKGKRYFGDIKYENAEHERYRYRFQAIASDLSDGQMVVLPGDLRSYGFDPDRFEIAKAVRMSMSIPVYYEPYILTDVHGNKHAIVDGGLLSNYPIWLLDDHSSKPPWPTFGFKFCSDTENGMPEQEYRHINNPYVFGKALVSTALDAHDRFYISLIKGDYQRTIPVSPKICNGDGERIVSTVDFGISKDDQQCLYENGFRSAKKFLATWDFEDWVHKYR